MYIEHIALWVQDLERIRKFYCNFFGGTANGLYTNAKTGFRSYFISFDKGARLELMSLPRESTGSINPYAGYAHMAFSLGSRDEVDRLTLSLRNSGFEISSRPRVTGDGYYESCVLDPEGNKVEITCG